MLLKVIRILILCVSANAFLLPVNTQDSQDLKTTTNQKGENYVDDTYPATVKKVHRLREGVSPTYYDLKIIPQLENEFNFTGEVMISFLVKTSGYTVQLHSRDLGIDSVQVSQQSGIEITTTYELDPEKEILTIKTETIMKYNTVYNLTISFNGILNDKNIGFYRSFYDVNNEVPSKKWLAVTQFQATYARMAFPCFDEPRYKVPFKISIARYPQQITTSNMPLESTSLPDPKMDNRVWDIFQETPPIATYLVAFMVSEFESEVHENIFIWSRASAKNYTSYALSESGPLLRRLEIFTGVKYSLPKLDMVAVPDFSFGGMENWGLTMYRERCLLTQDDQASEKNLDLITRLVAHEFSHMWFGDYVTPTWWSYLWLNEGFATYFEYFATAEEKPDWRYDEYFVVDVVHSALSVDGVKIHHPLNYEFEEASEVDGIFDTITYKKGGSVIRMLEHIVTTPTFKSVLNDYLTRNKEGSVTPEHLYDSFERKVAEDSTPLPGYNSITRIIRSWTDNIGYPLVTVSRTERGSIVFRQDVYRSPRSVKKLTSDDQWFIPISYTTKSKSSITSTKPALWIRPWDSTILEEKVNESEWILCNIQQSGYYRVNYESENWNLLINQLHEEPLRIDPVNRAQLIDDSFNLAFDEKIPFDIPLLLSTYLVKEQDPIPWLTALKHFEYLYSYFEALEIHLNVTEYITNIVEPWYTSVGLNASKGDDHLTRIVRPRIASLACKIGINKCVVDAVEYYEEKYDDLSDIQPDMKEVVFCTALKNYELLHTPSVWDNLWLLYKDTDIEFEKDSILNAFGCAHEEIYLKRFLYKLINHEEDDIRKHQTKIVLRSVSSTSTGVLATIHFLNDMLKRDENLTTENVNTLYFVAKTIKPLIHTEKQLRDLHILIVNINRLDFQKYGMLQKLLISAYDHGVMEVNKRMTVSKQISPSFRSIHVPKQEEAPTTYMPVTEWDPENQTEHYTISPKPNTDEPVHPHIKTTTEKNVSSGNSVAASSVLSITLAVCSVLSFKLLFSYLI